MVRVKAIKYERFSGGICDSCQATGKTPQSDTKDTLLWFNLSNIWPVIKRSRAQGICTIAVELWCKLEQWQ